MLTLSIGIDALAQQAGRDRIEAAKAAFITRELNLTVDEAQKFWPIFNELKKEQTAIRKQIRSIQKNLLTKNLGENELKQMHSKLLDARIQEIELERKYLPKMAEVIGTKRAVRVYPIEKSFLKMLLRNLEGTNEDDLSE